MKKTQLNNKKEKKEVKKTDPKQENRNKLFSWFHSEYPWFFLWLMNKDVSKLVKFHNEWVNVVETEEYKQYLKEESKEITLSTSN